MSEEYGWAEQDTVVTDGAGGYGEEISYVDTDGNEAVGEYVTDGTGDYYEEIDTVS